MTVSSVVKAQLNRILNDSQKKALKHLCRLLYRNNLSKLAVDLGTDKEGGHHYAKHYQRHFESLRREKLNILEIGIGGRQNPRGGGQSLRMWKAYFPKSHIFGIDVYDKTYHDEPRITTFRGSQIDEKFLRMVAAEICTIDIIIDDGSHYNDHVITTFKILFPLLSHNGIYVVEDLQTSYWDKVLGEDWGGSSDLMAPNTSMNFFKCLVDGLNYEEFTYDEYTPNYFDKHIISMHFYHNLLFICKGQNDEGSNILGKRFL
jgi:demethylmacrocin O-methyltransferase